MHGPPKLALMLDLARLGRRPRSVRLAGTQCLPDHTHGDTAGATTKFPDGDHLIATARWIAAAQDAGTDGGVAGHYSLRRGWSASYPETTGYLVPTLLRLAKEPHLEAFDERADRASNFLLRCQLPSGGFFGGLANQTHKRPSVFNTAQIICGLIAWHRHSNDSRALESAIRAGDWLISVQDDNGAWTRHVYQDVATTYLAYASCWLAELGDYTSDNRYRIAALRHLEWVLTFADPQTGWFDRCGFTGQQHADRTALTHTIAYTLAGVLMTSERLGVDRGIASVELAARQIARRFEELQWLPGILDARWQRRAHFACVTGTAQMAIVWLELFKRDRDAVWLRAAIAATEAVKRVQLLRPFTPELAGAIPGSDPVWGRYMRFAYPNWAAKYCVDALLDKRLALAIAQ